MGAAPPWGQSLLRSCLAAHSFPPPPPLDGASPASTVSLPNRLNALSRLFVVTESVRRTHAYVLGCVQSAMTPLRVRIARTQGVGAGRSAQRGTSGATTGPRGAQPP